MVQRYSRGYTLYATDNAEVYDFFYTALRGIKYHSTIAPFKCNRGDMGAYTSLKAHFCGPALLEKMFQYNVAIILTRTWNENSNIDYENFLDQQCRA